MNGAPTDEAGASRASFTSYAAGFSLSLLLTMLAFGLVWIGAAPRSVTILAIVALAVVQFLVHMHTFLHLDRSSSARWNLMALLFTLLIMALFVGGTLWIMHSLNTRMM